MSTARLRVYGLSALSAGISVSSITGSWSESSTHNTAPTFGTESITSGPVVTNTFLEIDVTALVTAQISKGSINLALLPRSSTSVRFSSREGSKPPAACHRHHRLTTNALPSISSGVPHRDRPEP